MGLAASLRDLRLRGAGKPARGASKQGSRRARPLLGDRVSARASRKLGLAAALLQSFIAGAARSGRPKDSPRPVGCKRRCLSEALLRVRRKPAKLAPAAREPAKPASAARGPAKPAAAAREPATPAAAALDPAKPTAAAREPATCARG